MTEEELDAAVDVISAVDAGVLQSLNQRVKARNKTKSAGSKRGPQAWVKPSSGEGTEENHSTICKEMGHLLVLYLRESST